MNAGFNEGMAFLLDCLEEGEFVVFADVLLIDADNLAELGGAEVFGGGYVAGENVVDVFLGVAMDFGVADGLGDRETFGKVARRDTREVGGEVGGIALELLEEGSDSIHGIRVGRLDNQVIFGLGG